LPPYRVLGIDPGTRVVGLGVVDREGSRLRSVAYRVVAPGRMKGDLPSRLFVIHEGIAAAIAEFKPDAVAIEEAYYGKSAQSALRIGEGRGVAILAARQAGIEVHQYPPATVKKAVTGAGNAHKTQVGHMVKVLLSIADEIPEDAADALAVAICHLHRA
jgi:crossover junction endodeoxyribonuclease RuvC